MGPPPTIPEPLQTFLYGRRRHPRHEVGCEAVLHGPSLPLACRVVDVSYGGMLLRVDRAVLARPGDGRRGGLVERNFGRAFRVDLLERDLSVEAELARLTWDPGAEDRIFAGCRFPRTLDAATLRRLGVEPEPGTDDTPDHCASACLPLCAREGERYTVVLHAPGEDRRVPLFSGPLVGAGENTLATFLPEVSLDDAATAIDVPSLMLEVRRGLQPMWTVRARPLAVYPVTAPEPGVEVVLLTATTAATLLTSRLAPSQGATSA